MRLRLWDIAKFVSEGTKKIYKKSTFYNLLGQSQNKNTISSFLKKIPTRLTSWGIAKKTQYLIAISIVIFIFGSAVYFVHQIYALTLYFTQSDWSGGADTNTTINSTNATGWTKFYSNTAGIDNSTSGEIKLKLETSP